MDGSKLGSNRTFMELKFPSARWLATASYRSNRTFMELKCDKANKYGGKLSKF